MKKKKVIFLGVIGVSVVILCIGLILSQDKNKLERDKDKDKDKEFASGTKIDKEVSFWGENG